MPENSPFPDTPVPSLLPIPAPSYEPTLLLLPNASLNFTRDAMSWWRGRGLSLDCLDEVVDISGVDNMYKHL